MKAKLWPTGREHPDDGHPEAGSYQCQIGLLWISSSEGIADPVKKASSAFFFLKRLAISLLETPVNHLPPPKRH